MIESGTEPDPVSVGSGELEILNCINIRLFDSHVIQIFPIMWQIRIRAMMEFIAELDMGSGGAMWAESGSRWGCASSIHTISVADLYHFGAGPDPERNLIRIRFRVRDSGRLMGNQD